MFALFVLDIGISSHVQQQSTTQGRIQDLKLGVAQNGLDWKSCGGYCIYIYMCLNYVVVYISNMIYICIWGGGYCIYVLKIRYSIYFKYDIYIYQIRFFITIFYMSRFTLS